MKMENRPRIDAETRAAAKRLTRAERIRRASALDATAKNERDDEALERTQRAGAAIVLQQYQRRARALRARAR
jgi:hypothetical protein